MDESVNFISYKKHEYWDFTTLLYPVFLAIILLIAKNFFKVYIFIHIYKFFKNINNTPQILLRTGRVEMVNEDDINQYDWKKVWIGQFKWWLKNVVNTDDVSKFTEACWEMTWSAWSFVLSLLILFPKSWFWNIAECLDLFEYHTITNDLKFYYITSLALYYEWVVTHFPNKRNLLELTVFIYNVITITILNFCWEINLTRIGSLIIFATLPVEINMNWSVLDYYANLHKLAKITLLYELCRITWTFFRTFVFPFMHIHFTREIPTIVVNQTILLEELKVLFILIIFLQWIRSSLLVIAGFLTFATFLAMPENERPESN